VVFSVALAQHHSGGVLPSSTGSSKPRHVSLNVLNAWVRLPPPPLRDTTLYMTLVNPTGLELKLIGGYTPVAQMVMPMADFKEQRGGNTVQGMRSVEFLALPKNGKLELRPGGKHLMLMGLKRPLKEGERIPLNLKFRDNIQMRVELTVLRR
jgi:periplasmic copper chaperone A